MKHVYLVGAQQRADALQKDTLRPYEKALVVRIDVDTGEEEVVLEHETPRELCADDDPNILFSTATILDGRMYVCTATEVLIYAFPSFEQLHHLSLPCFNDLHHVRPTPTGNLLVVNTGLDMVIECTMGGELLQIWNVLGLDPWGKFSQDTDYRRVASTKPHESHPNHVFYVNDEIWVTRCEQRDAVCLTKPGKRIDIAIQRPHDGLVRGDHVYFTTVDGHVVRANAREHRVDQISDLQKLSGDLRRPGWCRGLDVSEEDLAVVGFSRLRFTKWTQNINWIKGGMNAARTLMHRPSRIALFDLAKHRLLWEHEFHTVDLSAIFSVHCV